MIRKSKMKLPSLNKADIRITDGKENKPENYPKPEERESSFAPKFRIEKIQEQLHDFRKNTNQIISRTKTKYNLNIRELNQLNDKVTKVFTKDLKTINESSIFIKGDFKRLTKDHLPIYFLPIDKDITQLLEMYREFEKMIDKYKNKSGNKFKNLEKKSHLLNDINFKKYDSDITNIRLKLDNHAKVLDVLEKKVEAKKNEERQCAVLVKPVYDSYTTAKLLKYNDVNAMWNKMISHYNNEMVIFKIAFIEKVESILRPIPELVDHKKLYEMSSKFTKVQTTVKPRSEMLNKKVVELKNKVEGVIRVLYDALCSSKRNNCFIDLRNDWDKFSKNNKRIQIRVNKELEAIGYDEEDVLKRIGLIEKQLEWINGRLNVWREESRAFIYQNESFTEVFERIEDIMTNLEDSIYKQTNEKIWNKSYKAKIQNPKKEITLSYPEYDVKSNERLIFDPPSKLPLTYHETESRIKEDFKNTLETLS